MIHITRVLFHIERSICVVFGQSKSQVVVPMGSTSKHNNYFVFNDISYLVYTYCHL